MGEIADIFPRRTRVIRNWAMDTTIWDEFAIRDGDIIIATYPKSGTTWMQQIVAQLVFNGKSGAPLGELSPWLEFRLEPRREKLAALAAQAHRRFYKSHSPSDAIEFSPIAKYVYVARDGRDVVWSMHNMHASFKAFFYEAINAPPGPYGPPLQPPVPSVVEYFRTWLADDGLPWWSFWDNVRSWWAVRDLPNVLLVHFDDLKRDLPGEIDRIAAFLGFDISTLDCATIVEHCSFDYMKREAADMAPLGGVVFEGSPQSFINEGRNRRWQTLLTTEDNQRYLARAREQLGDECANWILGDSRTIA